MKMTRIVFFSFALTFLLAINLHSQKADRDDVLSLSASFLKTHFADYPRGIDRISVYGTDEEPLIYIVNLEPEGWILVSGNKGATPIIGFNYTGDFVFPEENAGNPAYNWLSHSAASLKDFYSNPAENEDIKWKEGFTEVPAKSLTVNPLITAEWGQGTGWNQFCPEDIEGPDNHALVGCVAVAMAQAISVYELPDNGVGEHTYDHYVYGTISTDYSQSTYRWDLMSDNTANEYSAKLLYDCATSVDMNFGPDGSSATTSKIVNSLKTYFSMDENITYLSKDMYGAFEWEGMMRSELMYGRPIVYRGRSDDGTSGHAFNVDGVVSDRYFHLNWGWSGSRNGYFYLHELNPGTRSYNRSQAAIIYIKPNATSLESAVSDNELKIYPNPVSDVVRFAEISPDMISSVSIYSISGTLLKSIGRYSNSEGVNLSDLKTGIYILEATLTDNTSVRKKVIKQ